MAANLASFWLNLDTKDVQESWTLGPVQGLFEKGFYNNKNFKGTVEKFFNQDLKRKTVMTITNYDSGEPEVYSEHNEKSLLLDVLHASQSAPSVFPF